MHHYMQHDGGGGSSAAVVAFERHDVTPTTLLAQAEAVAAPAGDVENVNGDLTARHAVARSGVAGVLAEAMDGADEPTKQQALQLVQGITVGAGSIRGFAYAVETFNATVDQLNREIRAGETPEEQAELKSARVGRHQTAVETLQAAARTAKGQLADPLDPEHVRALYAAGALPSYSPALFANLPMELPDPDQLPYDLAALTDEEQAQYAIDNPDQAAFLLPLLSEDVRALIGTRLSDMADDLLENDRRRLETSELVDFGNLLGAYGTDPVVATKFLTELGPEDLLALNLRVASSQRDYDQLHPDWHDNDRAEAIQNIQLALGSTLAAGTRGWTPEAPHSGPDPGSSSHVSAAWINQLLEAGEQNYELARAGGFAGDVRGYQLLAPLMSTGDHSPEFLSKIATNIVYFEQSFGDDFPGPWQGFLPGMPNDGLRLDWTQGWDDEKHPVGVDPMTPLMRGMADDPEAARQFFTSQTTYRSGEPPINDMVDYLLHERTWLNDAPEHMVTTHLNGYPDLGEALKAGTIGDGADERSADIVSTLVHSTYNRLDGEDPEVFSGADLVPPELRSDLAEIASQYMGSFHQAFGSNPEGDGYPDYLFDDADVYDSQGEDGNLAASLFLAELSKDPDGHTQIVASSNAWTLEELYRGTAGVSSPDEIERIVTGAVNRSSAVLGAADFGATTEIAQDNASDDSRHNKLVDLGVGGGKTIVSQFTGKVPGAGFVLDLVVNEIKSELYQDSTGSTNVDVGQLLSTSAENQADLVRDAVWASVPADEYPPGMDASTNLDDLTPDQAATYEQWLGDSPWGQELDSRVTDSTQRHQNGLDAARSRLQAYGGPQ